MAWKAARSAGVRGKEQGLSLILPGRVAGYRCQVGNPVSLDRSIRLEKGQKARHRHHHGMDESINELTLQNRHKSRDASQRPLSAVQRPADTPHRLDNIHKHDQTLLHEGCRRTHMLRSRTRPSNYHSAHLLALIPRPFPNLHQRWPEVFSRRHGRSDSLERTLETAQRRATDSTPVKKKRVSDVRDKSLPCRGERGQMHNLRYEKVVQDRADRLQRDDL